MVLSSSEKSVQNTTNSNNANRLVKFKSTLSHYVCDKCNKTFEDINDIINHSVLAHFLCNICGDYCKNASNLKTHKQTHFKVPNQCKFCDKMFDNSFNADLHMRKYYKFNLYKCKMCIKGFIHHGDLKRHIRSYHLVLKHKCSKCSKEYNFIGGLGYHMKNKHSTLSTDTISQKITVPKKKRTKIASKNVSNTYTCPICHLIFNNVDDFKNHDVIHI